jgi:hypothetical protein
MKEYMLTVRVSLGNGGQRGQHEVSWRTGLPPERSLRFVTRWLKADLKAEKVPGRSTWTGLTVTTYATGREWVPEEKS